MNVRRLNFNLLTALMHRYTQVSIVRITDLDEYTALEQQIREFGQIPDQLFMEPHPSKTIQVCIYCISVAFALPCTVKVL